MYFCNSFFIFFLLIPFVSAFSFRALFSIAPYYPAKKVNSSGQLETDYSRDKKLTFISRIGAIWKHVSTSRDRFENTPDKGLLGKSFTRILNVIWNYVIKGFCGTLLLILIYPALCVLVSVSSIVLGILTPVWYPIISLLTHLGFVIIFDWELCGKRGTCKSFFPILRILLKFLICGLLSPVLALFTALVFCPVSSICITLFAFIRKCFRKTWDGFMFYAILKPMAKVPANDTFIARRTAGPGLASNHFYQIQPEQGI